MSATPDEKPDEVELDEAAEPVEPEPTPEPEPAAEPGSLENPIVVAVEEDARFGVPPFARATAITNAQAIASQQSSVHGGASAPLGTDQVNALRVGFLDRYDSYWSRDPGRANGPFS